MNKFITRFSLFLLPLALLAVFPALILLKSQEVMFGVDRVIERNNKYIFMPSYCDVTAPFKYRNAVLRDRFDILVLGSSRVMQFRDEMFTGRAYNCGGATRTLEEYHSFLRSLPSEQLPGYLVIGLDQWMFNSATREQYAGYGSYDDWNDLSPIRDRLVRKSRNVYADLFAGKLAFRDIFREKVHPCYGISAHVLGRGFRNDGSLNNDNAVRQLVENDTTRRDYKFKQTYIHIRNGTVSWAPGETVDSKAKHLLDSLLQFCDEQEIEVLAFLPPFADAVYDSMQRSGKYTYMNRLYPTLEPVFRRYGFELYDFTRMSSSGSHDTEALDGFHGSEATHCRILLQILRSNDGSKLHDICAAPRMEEALADMANPFAVFDY